MEVVLPEVAMQVRGAEFVGNEASGLTMASGSFSGEVATAPFGWAFLARCGHMVRPVDELSRHESQEMSSLTREVDGQQWQRVVRG